MGFNTVVMVLNDRLRDVQTAPKFGERLASAILHWGVGRQDRGCFGEGQVISVRHADDPQVVCVHQNRGFLISDESEQLPAGAIWTMKEALERHGYKVAPPKRAPKRAG